ncbi:MAG: UDP-N-acetylmuramoyl-tripeptide--D-alanyl-D-alanine ligase [Bacillota bacterium]
MDLKEGRQPLFTVADLASVLGIGGLDRAGRETAIYGVSTDSRCVARGDLFVALEGERTDGHRYLDAAFSRGAVAALVREGRVPASGWDGILLEVPDPFWAVGEVAAWYRDQFSLQVIGVTGSVGKTTCKDMMAAILREEFAVLKTQGNYNTEIGVPLTLFGLRPEHEVAVLELAMRKQGDIRYLASVAGPGAGVLTRVSESHLEFLGSMESIARTKAELFEALPGDGWAVVNADDPWGRWIASRTRARVVYYGQKRGDDLTARGANVSVDDLGRAAFDLHLGGRATGRVQLPLAGRHHVENALAAACAGYMMGMSPDSIWTALARAELTGMRMQWLDLGRISVLNDAYNSSPTSCAAALDTLRECENPGRKVAILGDMLELGPRAEELHLEVGRRAATAGLDLLLTVGKLSSFVGIGAADEGFPASSRRHYHDNDSLIAQLPQIVRDGDVVLVKGSRGCQLESCVQALQRLFAGGCEVGSGG